MAEWNPNSTATKGLEWRPLDSGVVTLDSSIKSACQAMRQTVSQIIGTVKVRLGAIPVRGGIYALEVYDGETAVGGTNLTTVTAQPNEDVSGTGTSDGQWREDDGSTTTTIYTEIDETTLSITDYIYTKVDAGESGTYYGRFNTGGLSLTGKRIHAVKMRVRTREVAGRVGSDLAFGLNLSAVDYVGLSGLFPGDVWHEKTWYYNPSTNAPWTIAEIQALDTTDEFYLTASETGGTNRYAHVAMVELVVTISDETRIAVGTLNDSASALTANAFNSITVTTPTGGAWTKDGTGYHTYLLRRISSAGALEVIYHDEPDEITTPAAPYPAYSMSPTLDATHGYVTAMGSAQTHVFPIVQRTTVPADSTDSMPYGDVGTTVVSSGVDVEQEFSDAAAVAYGILRFYARNSGGGTPPSTLADLLVKIKRRSDNVQLGSTVTLTRATLIATDDIDGTLVGWRFWTVQPATPATLAAATQYYIEFSCTGTGTDAWDVVYVDTETHGDIASFGGTTDRGVVGGVEADRYDVIVTLATIPATPTGLAAAAAYQTIDATVCGVARIAYASISWTATAIGGSFTRYEIRRSEDGGVTWNTIAYVTTESVVTFADYESRRGISACYQIRVIRSDGAASDWSSSVCTNVPATGSQIVLVSNYDSTLNVAYERDPEANYEVLDAGAVVTHPIYGRDRQLGFQPTEELGLTVSYTLHVGFNTAAPAGGGIGANAFDPLRAIAKAALPYVCVLDSYGSRHYALLAVPSALHANPGERYLAEVLATEVSDIPYIVTKTS